MRHPKFAIPTASTVLRGTIFVLMIGASVTAARADSTVTMQDPTDNGTVTMQGSQQAFTIKFKITDDAYTFSSAKLLQQQSDGSFTQIDITTTSNNIQVNGVYDHTEAQLKPYSNSGGTNYKIVVTVYKFISDGMGGEKQVFGQATASNVTITIKP